MDDGRYLFRPIVFHSPERVVDPPSWLSHTPFAFWIVDALRPRTFVELGCHSGNSYSSFAQAVQTLGLPTSCYAVDTWLGDPHAGGFDESVFVEWSAYHERRFASFSRLIRSTFDEALEHFQDGAIDLLHIDGYHTFEAISHDFTAWRPKMSSRGVVLFHDINVRELDFGAWRLWEEVASAYPSFSFLHGHGLGVLGLGRDLPEPLAWLFAADDDRAHAVRLFFSRLGASVTAEHTAATANRQVADIRQSAAAAERDAATARQAIAEQERLRDALLAAEHEGRVLTAENVRLATALTQAEQALTDRLAELEALTARLDARETRRTHPTIVVVSHVGAWQPRAGNEYRLNRMLHWYRRQGYRVIPVIAPLPGEGLSRETLAATAAAFGNVIQVHRDGRIEHDLRDVPDIFDPIPKMLTPLPAADPDGSGDPRRKAALELDLAFCHDRVIATVLHLQQWLGPHVLQVEYIWMSRLLPFVRPDVLKVIDTVDVFSSIDRKVSAFGVRDVAIDPRDEAERLRQADLLIAIQHEECEELQRLAPGISVLTAGVDFDVVPDAVGSIAGRIVFVASGNPRNRKGLLDFIRLAWPRVRRDAPDAELIVVGGVAEALAGRAVPGVSITGAVDDVAPLYRDAALVINPAVAGTGAKIKTIEALCHLRPLVTWPAGIDGLDPGLASRCIVVRDWYAFGKAVVDVLTGRDVRLLESDRDAIAALVSPETTYAALDCAYRSFFERHGHAPAAEPGAETEAGVGAPVTVHAG